MLGDDNVGTLGVGPKEDDMSPIMDAVVNGDLTKVQSLIAVDHTLVNSKDYYTMTPLHFAARTGDKSILEFLLREGAEIEAENNFAITPVHEAVRNGNAEVLEILLRNKADVNCTDLDENTPLHMAVLFEDTECAKILLDNGANFKVKNNRDESPFDMAESDSEVIVWIKKYIVDMLKKGGP
eukprot:Phypoly_transcript_14555.p1 GENE.Phypoly_transcript_14555~~Phypoly_transcript_14555.p1  ORF type:complete len:182 (+),score=41.93 Phypoly_transcript_14555:394-939(+)